MKLNSIVFKMITPLVVITVLVVSGTLYATQNYLKNIVEEVFINLQIHHFKEIYKLEVSNILSNIERDGVTITKSQAVKEFLASDDAKNRKIPQNLQKRLLEFKELFKLDTIYVSDIKSKNYYDENGFVKTINPLDKESEWYLRALKNKKRFHINANSDITGTLHIRIDTIVGDIENPIGLAGGAVDVSNLLNLVLREINHDDSASALIIDNKNIIQSSSQNSAEIDKPFTDINLPESKVSALKEALKNRNQLTKYKIDSAARFIMLIPVDEIGWTVVVDFSKTEYLQSLTGVYNRIITGGAILLFLLIFFGWVTITYLISKPLKNISKVVSKFDYKSDFNPQDCKNMGYEVDMICNAFSVSSKMLRDTINRYKHNEELLKSIINATDDIIFYKDKSGVYVGCNDAYEKWVNKSRKDIIGKVNSDLYHQDISEHYTKIDVQVISEKRTILIEEKFENRDGTFAILQVKKSPFYDKNGNVNGLVVIARDITAIKNMESDLRILNSTLEKKVEEKTHEIQKANETLEEHIGDLQDLNVELLKAKEEALRAAQARSNFISGISHELRTPLNAIINFTDQVIEDFDEMLVDKELQADTQIFLKRVIVNSRHLLQLINDLLEFTKAEAGKMDYKIEEQDLNQILKMAYNNIVSLLNGTDIKFNLVLSEKPIMANVDSRRFLQILLNLLSNAIKFTKKGSIELRIFERESGVFIEVKDTGKGIPFEKQKIIFEPFMQVNNTDNGTGLGLGLAKRMCKDMNIDISLTSIEGRGTTFILFIKKV